MYYCDAVGFGVRGHRSLGSNYFFTQGQAGLDRFKKKKLLFFVFADYICLILICVSLSKTCTKSVTKSHSTEANTFTQYFCRTRTGRNYTGNSE